MSVQTRDAAQWSPAAEAFDDARYRHVEFLDEPMPKSAKPVRGRSSGNSRRIGIEEELQAESLMYFDALCGRWGLSAQRYRRSIFRRREAASLRALRATCVREAMKAVQNDPARAEQALRAVMIGVTSFFRDPTVFESLRIRMQQLHEQRCRLRVLSVGCSDGSELYSTAMLLADDGLLGGSRLRGVDCRPDAIEKARAGVYPADTVAELSESLIEQHFEPASLQFWFGRQKERRRAAVRVRQPLRDSCEWEVADGFALTDQQAGSYDVILCRNVAIYLTIEAAAELWNSLASLLSPGGLLVVGKAERPPEGVREKCDRVSRCIYQKKVAE